jgi:hypothetical protein
MDFVDIDKNLNNGNNMGGIAQEAYFAKWEDVATWPTQPDATAADIEANGELTGDLVMNTGKKMNKIYITDDTGEFVIESVGETDGKSFITHLSLFNPGLKKKVLGFMNYAKNENLVFIVKDNDGQYYLMGDDTRPATYAGAPDSVGTGKETAARRGVSMEFVYKCKGAYVYTGAIPLTEAASS